MMGKQKGGQEKLFYSFNLEDHVPQNHLLRGIDSCLDLNGLRQHLAEHYSQTDDSLLALISPKLVAWKHIHLQEL